LSDIPAGVPARLDAVKKDGVPVLAWGNFLTIGLNFVFSPSSFVMIKQMNRPKKEVPAVVSPPTEEIVLLRQIRDSLKVPDNWRKSG